MIYPESVTSMHPFLQYILVIRADNIAARFQIRLIPPNVPQNWVMNIGLLYRAS